MAGSTGLEPATSGLTVHRSPLQRTTRFYKCVICMCWPRICVVPAVTPFCFVFPHRIRTAKLESHVRPGWFECVSCLSKKGIPRAALIAWPAPMLPGPNLGIRGLRLGRKGVFAVDGISSGPVQLYDFIDSLDWLCGNCEGDSSGISRLETTPRG